MSANPPLAPRPLDPVRPAMRPADPAQGGAAAPLVAAAPRAEPQVDAHRGPARRAEPQGVSPFLPILIFFLAWLAWGVFQAVQLHEESKSLDGLRASQQPQVEQAQRVRQTLDTLALETQKLAEAGNQNARLVIEELRKRGITVNRPAAQQPAAK